MANARFPRRVANWSLTICYLLVAASAVHAQTPIRISGDSSIRYNASVMDSNTLQSIQWVRGDTLTFEIGLFDRGRFVSSNISRFTNLTFAVFASQNDTNAPMMLQIVTNAAPGTNNGWNTNCALANWTNGPTGSTNQNVVFNFTAAQSSIPLNSQASQSYWLRLYALTTDSVPKTVTYLETPATVYDGPISAIYNPPAWDTAVAVDSSGNLVSPANFFTENFTLLTNALILGGFSGGGGSSSGTPGDIAVFDAGGHLTSTNVEHIASLNTGSGPINGNIQDTITGWPYNSTAQAILAGDSLTTALLAGGSNYFFFLTNQYGMAFSFVTNTSIPGQTAYSLMTNFQNEIGQFAPGAGTNTICFVWAGVNDLPATVGASAIWTVPQLYGFLTNIWYRCHTNGMKVVAFEVTPSLINQQVEPERIQLNTLIYNSSSGLMGWDYLIQVAVPDPASSPQFYADGVTHYNVPAYQEQASVVYNTLIRSTNMQHGPFTPYLLPLVYATGSQSNYNAFLVAGNETMTGSGNTAAGWLSLFNDTSGNNIVAVGYGALYENTTGANDVADGYGSMFYNLSGTGDVAVGYQAMFNNTAGNFNTALGTQAAYSGLTAGSVTAVGSSALYSNTASYNTALGANALLDNVTGAENTAVGYGALLYNDTASANVAIGYGALLDQTGGSGNNTAVGFAAALSNIVGSANTAVGYQSLYANTNGNGNTALGYQSLYTATASSANTALGYDALFFDTGANNTATGFEAMFENTTGAANTADGYGASFNNTSGGNNVSVGFNSAFYNTSGSGNTAVGFEALQSNILASYCTAVGAGALQNSTGAQNTAVGANALLNTTGANNTAFGYDAGLNLTAASDEVLVGYGAGLDLTTGAANTALGYEALATDAIGGDNTAIGYFALQLCTGTENTAVGYGALSSTTGNYNTAFGLDSGSGVTTGQGNNFFGFNVGGGITSGSWNTIVGGQVSGLPSGLVNTVILADGQGNIRFQDWGNGTASIPSTVTNLQANLAHSTNLPPSTGLASGGAADGQVMTYSVPGAGWFPSNAAAGSGTVTSIGMAVGAGGVISSWLPTSTTTSATFTPTFASSLVNLVQNWIINGTGALTNTPLVLTNRMDSWTQTASSFAAFHAGTNWFSGDPTNGISAPGLFKTGAISNIALTNIPYMNVTNFDLDGGLFQVNRTNAPSGEVLTAIDGSGHVAFRPSGGGTVTSVAAAADSAGVVSWAGSPITGSGTLTPTFAQASSGQFGVVEVDGTTITASSGVITAHSTGGAPFTFNQGQFSGSGGTTNLASGLNTTNENVYNQWTFHGGAGSNSWYFNGVETVDSWSTFSLAEGLTGDTNFYFSGIDGAEDTNIVLSSGLRKQIGANITNTSSLLGFTNTANGSNILSLSSTGVLNLGGQFNAGSVSNSGNETFSTQGDGPIGSGAWLTNLVDTNMTLTWRTNALTVSGDLNSSSNWFVNFATNPCYRVWIPTNVCITNIQGLTGGRNYGDLYLRNTNTSVTYYISFSTGAAALVSGPYGLFNGFTNVFPLTNSQGWFHFHFDCIGTNYQSTNNCTWEMSAPSQ
jgi:hypothetical protein